LEIKPRAQTGLAVSAARGEVNSLENVLIARAIEPKQAKAREDEDENADDTCGGHMSLLSFS
jgi:hypothetical protein